MSSLPRSFDPMLLQDELLKVFKNSPQTQALLPMRTKQVISKTISSFVSSSMMQAYQREIVELTEQLCKEQKKRQRVLTSSKKEMTCTNRVKQQLEQRINSLQDELNRKDEIIRELQENGDEYEQGMMKLAEEVREKEIALEAICSEVDRLNIDKEKYVKEMSERVQNEKYAAKVRVEEIERRMNEKLQKAEKEAEANRYKFLKSEQLYLSAKHQLVLKQSQLAQKDQQRATQYIRMKEQYEQQRRKKQRVFQNLNNKKLGLSNGNASLKEQNSSLKIELESLRVKYRKCQSQISALQKKRGYQKHLVQQQRQMMNNKLVELTNRLLRAEMVYERVRIMQRTIIGLKQEQEGIRVVFQWQMKEVLGLVTGNFGKMLDEVGKTMANELSLLAANLTHKTNEIALYRKQIKIKDEIITKLQNMLDCSSYNTIELRNELRLNKRQAEGLRKQLKNSSSKKQDKEHKEHKEHKLVKLQPKIDIILKDSTNIISRG